MNKIYCEAESDEEREAVCFHVEHGGAVAFCGILLLFILVGVLAVTPLFADDNSKYSEGLTWEYIILLVIAAFAAFSCFVFSQIRKQFLRPLSNLVNGTKDMAKGNFSGNFDIEHGGWLREYLKMQKEIATGVQKQLRKKDDEIDSVNWEIRGRERALIFARQSCRSQGRELQALRRQIEMLRMSSTDSALQVNHVLLELSSEVRTPLEGILSMCEMLNINSDQYQSREIIRALRETTGSLLETTDNFISTVDSAHASDIGEDTFSLRNIISHLCRIFSITAQEKGLELVCRVSQNLPKSVRGDRRKFNILLSYLLDNSIRFTSSGHICIRVRPDDFQSGKVLLHIEIEDTGKGIAMNNLSRIFDKSYSTADSEGNTGCGTGLGNCRQLVEDMGGRIFVESEVGSGSRFVVEIAFEIFGEIPAGEIIVEAVASAPKVLVVDDCAPAGEMLATSLVSQGFAVTCVCSAMDAVREFCNGRRFASVWIDQNMPEMDGISFCQWLESSRVSPKPAIVLLTPSLGGVSTGYALRCGFNGVMRKPVFHEDVLSVLKQLDTGYILPVVEKQASGGERLITDKSKRVLLAQANSSLRRAVLWHLHKAGFAHVDITADATETLDYFSINDYALVVLDYQFSHIDGALLIDKLRHIEMVKNHKRTKVLAITENIDSDETQKGLLGGADGFLSKPFSRSKFEQAVHELLGETVENKPVVTV